MLALNQLVGTSSLILQVLVIGLLVLYVVRHPAIEKLVAKYALWAGFALSLSGVVISLVYSEYYGLIPCGLCWFGRIFLYPQALIFAIALGRRDSSAVIYTLWLSVIGLIISGYHHYLQLGGNEVLPCPASGASDCARRYLFEYGYITFPLVGFMVFAAIITLSLFVLRQKRAGVKT